MGFSFIQLLNILIALQPETDCRTNPFPKNFVPLSDFSVGVYFKWLNQIKTKQFQLAIN